MRSPVRWRQLYDEVTAICVVLLCFAGSANADELRVAVAANFKQTLTEICAAFFHSREGKCIVTSGASGLLYAQIRQGAPFDVFLSADAARPARLVSEGLAVPGTRFTYAIGQLVFWRPGGRSGQGLREALMAEEGRVLALANPETAPYGVAARDTLQALELSEQQFRVVIGENVAQAFQFVGSGAADAGFVSRAQVTGLSAREGRYIESGVWSVDKSLHESIEQQAVLLHNADNVPEAQAFLAFLRSTSAAGLIRNAGYIVPGR